MKRESIKDQEELKSQEDHERRENFYEFMRWVLPDLLGDQFNVEFKSIIKRNDTSVDVMEIADKRNPDMSATFPTEPLFQMVEDGLSLKGLINFISESLMFPPEALVDEKAFFKDYETLQKHLSLSIVDRSSNRCWLKDKIWRPMGDFGEFAIVCCMKHTDPQKLGCDLLTAMLKKEHSGMLDVSVDELWETAEANFSSANYEIMSLVDALRDEDVLIPKELEPKVKLYVLSTVDHTYGATLITRADVLKEVGDMLGDNFYILPTSIDEVAIVAEHDLFDLQELENLLWELNKDLDPQEKLSDKVLFYDRIEEELRNARSSDGKDMTSAASSCDVSSQLLH